MINTARLLTGVLHPPAAEGKSAEDLEADRVHKSKVTWPHGTVGQDLHKRRRLFPSQKSRIQKVSVCLKTDVY